MKLPIDLAVAKGSNGIEPDSGDSYQHDTCFGLTYNDQLKFNRFIANYARS